MSAEYWNYVTSGFVPFLTFCVACGMGVFSIGLAVYVVLYMWNGGSEPEFFRSKSVKIKSDKFADPAESKRKKQQRPVVSIKSKKTDQKEQKMTVLIIGHSLLEVRPSTKNQAKTINLWDI